MKIISVEVQSDWKNNEIVARSNYSVFYYDVFIKCDSFSNVLKIHGCTRGGMFAFLTRTSDNDCLNLYHVPSEIKSVLEKMHDKVEGFRLNDMLIEDVKTYLIRELTGLEFQFSSDDADRISMY